MSVTLYEIGEVSFLITCIGMIGFHVKAEGERFTSASSRCRQKLKYENSKWSFGRLCQKIAPKGVINSLKDLLFDSLKTKLSPVLPLLMSSVS